LGEVRFLLMTMRVLANELRGGWMSARGIL
jgi:hypothetical protein